jgi:hypothetical protein
MMVWNQITSRYEKLNVTSVVFQAGTSYDVVLSSAPAKTLLVGDYICPDTERRLLIAQTVEQYFDSLGPGEVVDLTNDTRAHRALRFPVPSEEWPQRAGAAILNYLLDALGGSLSDTTLESMSLTTPSLPADPTDSARMIIMNNIGVYAG